MCKHARLAEVHVPQLHKCGHGRVEGGDGIVLHSKTAQAAQRLKVWQRTNSVVVQPERA